MSSSELLRKMGYHYNPRPTPDVFGRRAATPVEIQKVLSGEIKPQENIIYERGRSKKPHRR
jgi:hypothetical protein